ncbi:Type III pantothenate kinase [Geodia barretti]|uniref:Type III pantothenate kinase n=1 Tax=Geodia barretti TaxID=519541 RepID=A0AA35WQ28_GEOBA|nr:Type III pantothenate kinase [Geodia barretti]
MLLALDIGNTNIKIGVFADDPGDDPYTSAAAWRINTERGRTADEYGLMTSNMLPTRGLDARDVTSVAMCSGVPSLTSAFVEVSETYFGQSPLVVGAGVKTGIRILYDNPRDVGADRIVDAAAALKLYGRPAIVVDFGTGTVFDARPRRDIRIAPVYTSRRAHSTRRRHSFVTSSWSGPLRQSGVIPSMRCSRGWCWDTPRWLREWSRDSTASWARRVEGHRDGGPAHLIAEEEERERRTGGNGHISDVVNDNLTMAGLKIIHEMNVPGR